AGITREGQANQTGNLVVTSEADVTLSGVQQAKERVTVSAKQITANSSHTQAQHVELRASKGNVETRKAVVVAKQIT
ncbi:hypothetical protein, partial [Rosenbergiella australiborealis]